MAKHRHEIRDQSHHDAPARTDAELYRDGDREARHDEVDAEQFAVEEDEQDAAVGRSWGHSDRRYLRHLIGSISASSSP